MKLSLFSIFAVLTFVFTVNWVFFEFSHYLEVASIFRALLFPAYFLMYYFNNNRVNKYFSGFLLFFALAEAFYLLVSLNDELSYYGGIFFYLLSYLSLIIFFVKKITLNVIISRYAVHTISLIIASVYLLLSLDYFFIEEYPNGELSLLTRIIENSYNFLLLILLVFSYVYFLSRQKYKALILFVSCAFIVFSELIQISVYLTETNNTLALIYTMLLVFGFYFLFLYFNKSENENSF